MTVQSFDGIDAPSDCVSTETIDHRLITFSTDGHENAYMCSLFRNTVSSAYSILVVPFNV